ncbi:MAG: hypothetical protein AAFV53_36590 [Myxococcota bacterium]
MTRFDVPSAVALIAMGHGPWPLFTQEAGARPHPERPRGPCRGPLGKQALTARISTVCVVNIPEPSGKGLTLDADRLTVTVGGGGSRGGSVDSAQILTFLRDHL